jgi:hypothetical protein
LLLRSVFSDVVYDCRLTEKVVGGVFVRFRAPLQLVIIYITYLPVYDKLDQNKPVATATTFGSFFD